MTQGPLFNSFGLGCCGQYINSNTAEKLKQSQNPYGDLIECPGCRGTVKPHKARKHQEVLDAFLPFFPVGYQVRYTLAKANMENWGIPEILKALDEVKGSTSEIEDLRKVLNGFHALRALRHADFVGDLEDCMMVHLCEVFPKLKTFE